MKANFIPTRNQICVRISDGSDLTYPHDHWKQGHIFKAGETSPEGLFVREHGTTNDHRTANIRAASDSEITEYKKYNEHVKNINLFKYL